MYVKLDGACGTGYRLDGEMRGATRGSFSSPQALAAERIWKQKYAQHDQLFLTELNHLTPVCEIIDPCAKQVVKYDFVDLVLIACKNRHTGENMRHEDLVKLGARIGMPVVEKIESENIEAVLQLVGNLDGNAEGFVSCWWNPNPPAEGTFFDEPYRVKTKGELYKLRHRMLAGITPSVLANAWRDGSIVDLLPILEEEYREDTEALVRQLDANTVALVEQIEAVYRDGAQHQDQKAFAAWVKTQPSNLAGLLFARKQLDYPKSASQ